MSKHTPGPWVVDVYGDVTANGEDVARIASSYDCAEHDARLIAAAPCMLSAMIEAKDAMESSYRIKGKGDDWIYDEIGSEMAAGYFSLRAAIAKAKGEA